jgi:murein DD-endopeptidase MepM/ murein hydrolase activator NlpD
MQHQKGKWRKRKTGTLSLLFVPHRGRLRTLRIVHWKALFRAVTLLALLAVAVGAVFTVQTLEENETLRLTLAQERSQHDTTLASLNLQLASQTALLAEADRTFTAHQDAALLSDRTLNNYKQEYESLVLAYVDTNYAATSISRGESDSDTFREEITTLRALIETAEEAALEVSTQDTLLARKADEIAEQLRHLPSVWPTVPDAQVHSTYGRRFHPVFHYYKKHDGVDLGEHTGDPLYASGAGTVTMAEWHTGYGNLVEIDHGNGYTTRYGHCSKLLVKVGDVVEQGQEIAKMGETGTATGPHVHFEIRVNGATVDPLPFIRDQKP